MSNRRRLWQIFGPVICAFILLIVIFLLPWERTFSKADIFEAAASQTKTVFKGQRMKGEAYSNNYVPFYGSSELSRMDPLHPTVLAYKYHRNYMPFLQGGPGSQSLSQYFGMQGNENKLTDKKAVVIISPQWFTAQGQIPAAFSLYYSPLHACDFLLHAKNSVADRYAAKRLLKMPVGNSKIIRSGIETVASGGKLSGTELFWIRQRRQMLLNEDTFFSSFQLHNRIRKIKKEARLLPKHYSLAGLTKVANRQGASHTSNNDLGIDNSFFAKRLGRRMLAKLHDSQISFNYTKSPEYADFELMLDQLAKEHTNVLFIIPPVNAKWAKYTGLSQKMYQESVAKIKHQLLSQGFDNIEDLSSCGGKKYFMQDTIHLGWNGWVAADRAVKPFMDVKNFKAQYQLSNYYYSKAWQNRVGVAAVHTSNRDLFRRLKSKVVRQNVAKMGLKSSSVLVMRNGQVALNDSSHNKNDTAYLINSVQKPLTAAMVMREVEKGRLKLNDRIGKFFPKIAGGSRVTVQNLLDMNSGLELVPGVKIAPKSMVSDQANLNRLMQKTVFVKADYGREHYNSLDFVLLSGILARVSGRSYESLFRRTYVNSLHLRHTAFMWNKRAVLKKVGWRPGYYWNKKKGRYVLCSLKKAVLDARGDLGAGSVVMSSSDLAKAMRSILDGKLLSRPYRDRLFKGTAPKYYGGGFYNYPRLKAANGAGEGYYTFIRCSKNGSSMLIIQSNYTIPHKFGKFKLLLNDWFLHLNDEA